MMATPANQKGKTPKPSRRLARIFRSCFAASARRPLGSAGFQPAVSPISNRQTIGKTEVVWNGQALRVGNPRHSRLAAVAPQRRYGAPRRRKVCATAQAGLNYKVFGLAWSSVPAWASLLLAAFVLAAPASEPGVVPPIFHSSFQAASDAAAADQSLVLLILAPNGAGRASY